MAGATHGGAELFYERLCIALHQAGETLLAVIRHDQARAARLRAAGLDVVQLGFGGLLDISTRRRLSDALHDFAPDVAVSWMNRASGHMPPGSWVSVGRLGGYYDLRHYRHCEHLVGNTHGIVAWLRERGWPEARTHYLPNFSADLGGAALPADLYAVSRSVGPILLGLGRLHRDKGFDILISALGELPGARLLLAGTGPEQARLERLARSRGVASRVVFLGWRADVASLLALCSVFVCSSRVEPLGNMVLEAWSAGRPVVAAAADGPAELIRDGSDGLLVRVDDPTELAAGIRRMLDDPALAERLGQAGRRRFECEFAAPAVVAQWRAFLSDPSAYR